RNALLGRAATAAHAAVASAPLRARTCVLGAPLRFAPLRAGRSARSRALRAHPPGCLTRQDPTSPPSRLETQRRTHPQVATTLPVPTLRAKLRRGSTGRDLVRSDVGHPDEAHTRS